MEDVRRKKEEGFDGRWKTEEGRDSMRPIHT